MKIRYNKSPYKSWSCLHELLDNDMKYLVIRSTTCILVLNMLLMFNLKKSLKPKSGHLFLGQPLRIGFFFTKIPPP
jgi:hypothetical protein